MRPLLPARGITAVFVTDPQTGTPLVAVEMDAGQISVQICFDQPAMAALFGSQVSAALAEMCKAKAGGAPAIVTPDRALVMPN